MPELPEVEAARKRLSTLAKGKKIKSVIVNEDPLVFSGTTHASFAAALEGKTVLDVRRKGKNFYLILSPGPLHPIFHFGMTGMAHVRGTPSPVYRVPRSKSADEEWPPKYMKTQLTFCEPDDEEEKVVGEWAFCDPRRLGRIKLVEVKEGEELESVPPLCELGRDPLLDMPSVKELELKLMARVGPIKAVLLDQKGPLCGLGNYMVDEILFQSATHPSHPIGNLATISCAPYSPTSSIPSCFYPTLRALRNPSPDPIVTLHANILYVTRSCVDVDADAERYPEGWLFKHRWGKGKKKKKGEEEGFVLPDGTTSPLSFVTVSGRTSAVVDKLQILPHHFVKPAKPPKPAKRKKSTAHDDDAEREVNGPKAEAATPKKRKSGRKVKETAKTEEGSGQEGEDGLDREAEVMEEQVQEVEEEKEVVDVVTSPHFKRQKRADQSDDADSLLLSSH
ncbi:hypothetical protein JCM11251_004376 [Rhodosporidiobolus azoricus]